MWELLNNLLLALTAYNLAGIIIFVFFCLILYLLYMNNKNTREMIEIMKGTVKCETSMDCKLNQIDEKLEKAEKIHNKTALILNTLVNKLT
jgi:hypothetical protein